MAFCKSCGVGVACRDVPRPDGSRKGLCDRPVDNRGNHIRRGKKFNQINGKRK